MTPTGSADRFEARTVERFRRQDPRAFEEVFDGVNPIAYALARRICGCGHLADDVVQNAFLDVWRRAPTYEPALASVSTWILRIVRNRSIDAVRRVAVHQRRKLDDDQILEHVVAAGGVLEEVIDGDRARLVRIALDGLPDAQRRVIEMSFVGGLSHAEIAARLGLPVGTVKSRVRLGLNKLRQSVTSTERAGARADCFDVALQPR